MSVRDVVQAAAGALGGEALYVEDVFSTYLYTGNSSTQTITNGIDLSGEGGLVWIKSRSSTPVSQAHMLADTERGPTVTLGTDDTAGNASDTDRYDSFNSDGFSIKSSARLNYSNNPYASWTFRKAPKFFDVVTWTGDGTNPRAISHNLGSVPGCFIVKSTSNSGTDWRVYHRSLGSGSPEDYNLKLHATDAQATTSHWANTAPTDSVFYVSSAANVNASGYTYVAYLFAHNAGGFGADGTEDVISCGSYTGNGSSTGPVVTLGWEPQWLMVKNASTGGTSWMMFDTMRGLTNEGSDRVLEANASSAELDFETQYVGVPFANLLSTGFQLTGASSYHNASGDTYIYIAIRRPHKPPTAGTDVLALHPLESSPFLTPGWPVDFGFWRPTTTYGWLTSNRLTAKKLLYFNLTDAEATEASMAFDYQNQFTTETGQSSPAWMFRRAPSFFDVVAYTGTGSATTVAHNLGVAPELMIVKNRNNTRDWRVYYGDNTKSLVLNTTTAAATSSGYWNNTSPTSSVFTVGTDVDTNYSSFTYIAYLFATLAGVSKVGTYTGTAADLNVDCGFTTGPRFVLIKRVDAASSAWYLWDSVRGIVAGNDPYLLLNSTAAEVTSTDYIDPLAAGFTVTSSAPAALNASGGTYIFLAIA